MKRVTIVGASGMVGSYAWAAGLARPIYPGARTAR